MYEIKKAYLIVLLLGYVLIIIPLMILCIITYNYKNHLWLFVSTLSLVPILGFGIWHLFNDSIREIWFKNLLGEKQRKEEKAV